MQLPTSILSLKDFMFFINKSFELKCCDCTGAGTTSILNQKDGVRGEVQL